jgi:hypothetical protein
MVGVAITTMTNGASGLVQMAGIATVNGSSYTIGDRVYLSPTTAGNGTSTAPTVAPNTVALIGVAVSTTQVLLQPLFVAELQ